MTNIEEYQGMRESRRPQTNAPAAAFGRQEQALWLRPRVPDPGLGGCEAYQFPSLVISNGEAPDSQVILDEGPNFDPRVIRIRKLKAEIVHGRQLYRNKIRKEYERLIAQCKVVKNYWHGGPGKPKWLKPWYEKQWTGYRWVHKKVFLKPRIIAYRALVSNDLSTGKRVYEIRRKTIRPFRWVEVRKPKFTYRLKRKGMLVQRRTRVATPKVVTDWNEVRKRISAFKITLLDERLALLDKRQQLIVLRKHLVKQPRLAASWTTSGFVQPPTMTVPVLIPWASNPRYSNHPPFGFQFPAFVEDDVTHPYGEVYVNSMYLWDETLEGLKAKIAADRPSDVYYSLQETMPANDVAFRLNDHRSVVLADGEDAKLSRATVEPEKVLKSYVNVATLTKADDYAFQIVRSVGELKDARGTYKQGKDFLRWLANPKLKGLSPHKVYMGLSACYLAWKFAIQPTIQDVQTVIDNTVEYLTDIRRSLRNLVNDLETRSSIYHARAAYASAKGLVRGSILLHADNQGSFDRVKYTMSWTRRYKHAVQLTAMPTLTKNNELNCSLIQDPTDRGFKLQAAYWPHLGTEALDIEDEADDGTKVTIANGLYEYQRGIGVWSGLSHSEDTFAFARRIQHLNAFPLPFGIQDLATGVVFASYHMKEIVELALDGRIGRGTIQRFINQTMALESWLKNQEAQKAAVRELLRHADIPYVAWQLFPLSFVYDWFTTSGTIAEALSSLAREGVEAVPQTLNGVWQAERHELFSVVPNLRLERTQTSELVREWTIVGMQRGNRECYVASPARSTIYCDSIWVPSPGTASFSRTGLYRFRRGEYELKSSLPAFAPRLKVSLDRGKLVTLSAMLGGLFAHRF